MMPITTKIATLEGFDNSNLPVTNDIQIVIAVRESSTIIKIVNGVIRSVSMGVSFYSDWAGTRNPWASSAATSSAATATNPWADSYKPVVRAASTSRQKDS